MAGVAYFSGCNQSYITNSVRRQKYVNIIQTQISLQTQLDFE